MLKKITNDLEKTSIEKMVRLKNEYKKVINKLKNDLSNNQKFLNKKKEISSSSGNTSDTDSIDIQEQCPGMPFLETEEEAAENIAYIYEQKDTRKKDYKNQNFCPGRQY